MIRLPRDFGHIFFFLSFQALASHSLCAAALRDGDIVFQDSQSSQSQAIKEATHSPYSHVGIVVTKGGKTFVAEAVQPVKITPLDAWIARGRGGHYVAKRLKGPTLDKRSTEKILAETKKYLGKDYDWQFAWSDREIYCSELVWKIYRRSLGVELCQLRSLKEFDLSRPTVRKTLEQRYGNSIPLAEPVVAPSDLFQSPQLTTVETQRSIP